ncbi:MAG TPA: hypothetical protein DIT07_09395 [Sphingobacteriaceae bacterium]|nr:hypothetical protein [Sphingobacteriaceae bacterium]
MTIHEFIQLDVYEKAEVAWTGIFIADRMDKGDIVQLYLLDDFFVEIFYNLFDNEIITVRSFTNSHFLEAYCERIDISSVVC